VLSRLINAGSDTKAGRGKPAVLWERCKQVPQVSPTTVRRAYWQLD